MDHSSDTGRPAPRRVLCLITSLGTGGAERVLGSLAERLDKDAHRLEVVSLVPGGAQRARIETAGVTTHSLDIGTKVQSVLGTLRLARLVRRSNPDVVMTWLYHSDLLGMLLKLLGFRFELFWNVRCSNIVGEERSRLLNVLVRLLALGSRVPTAVISNSRSGIEFHRTRGYRPRRWLLIPNGVDTDAFRRDPERGAAFRARYGIPAEAKVVCSVARNHPMKDHRTLAAALARLAAERDDLYVLLAGTNVDVAHPELMGMFSDLRRGTVHFLGELEDVPALLSAADVFCLPSAYGEGCPNALLEAMACELPCVATDVGDCAAILEGRGETVPPRDPAALAGALGRAAALGPEERATRGRAAREWVSSHASLDDMVMRYRALFDGRPMPDDVAP